MPIEIVTVDSKALLKEYIYLCERIYKNVSRWVPPFYLDEWDFHNPEKNRALPHCETIRVLAYQNNQAVGRIMGIIHHPYNDVHHEKTARFFHFDCIDEQQVAHTLIKFIDLYLLAFQHKKDHKLVVPYKHLFHLFLYYLILLSLFEF